MITKEFVTLNVREIKPYENNPRVNDEAVADVVASIEQCENLDPIEVDEANVILSGHTRLKALKRLGYKTTEVLRYTGLTEDQKKKYRLLANKTGEIATWDIDKLAVELDGLDFEGYDFGFGFAEEEEEPEIIEDDYPVVLPEEPATHLGDIYQLGDHRLLCGDATDITQIERLLDGTSVDLFLTDPPYNVAYEGGTKEKLTIMNDSMEDTKFRQFLASAFEVARQVMRDGAVFYIWHADSEGYNFRGALHDVGLTVRQCLIWVKNALVLGRQDYQWKHEPCLYGWKDGASHYWSGGRKQRTSITDTDLFELRGKTKDDLLKWIEEYLLDAEPEETTILYNEKPKKNKDHPTMKPIRLIARLVENSSQPGDAVLDTFGGSGSTLIACEQLHRRCFMSELDPKYCDVIINRWESFTGQKAVLLNG